MKQNERPDASDGQICSCYDIEIVLIDVRRYDMQKHTTGGIPRWSPTLVLVARFSAYVWQSGRDAQFSLTYGRMCLILNRCIL
jgi:hypothetical protein